SAWLVATPSTLAQDWALAALQSPLAALRRPSPYMRERRDFMIQAADALAARVSRARRRVVQTPPEWRERAGGGEDVRGRFRLPPHGRRRRHPVRGVR